MKVTPYTEIPLEDVNAEGAKATRIRWMIAEKDGAPNFAMRLFEVEPGGFTPYHSHSWEHEVFCVEGMGMFVTEKEEIPFKTGDVIYADPELKHQFRNVGDTVMKFICVVPHAQKKPSIAKKARNPFAAGTANNC